MKWNVEKTTKTLLFAASLVIIIIASGMVLSLMNGSIPAFKEFGLKFIISTEWNPTEGNEHYGALPFIVGTILTSVIAIIICIPLAFSTSLFISELYRGTKVASIIGTMVDMLAGIPSIVYGLWGFYVLRPWIIDLGFNSQGYGIFTAGLILAIMVIPYATSISTEIMLMVSNDLKEAAYSLGATRREVIFNVLIPNARSGIFTSFILAFGRALGETMAVTMLIGNANIIPKGIFDTGNTMASIIANQFGEADGLKLSSLIAIGLLLFVMTGLINGLGKFIIKKL
ncbi:MAG: phosphate ABC transporter permease subunit PstC [Bacteroidetes bacterium CG2_30_33_31]|nr:MAG: phosphate ABC transporter permease subunit PstC [Bacteroidetes bacterium CG2_30_33_31]